MIYRLNITGSYVREATGVDHYIGNDITQLMFKRDGYIVTVTSRYSYGVSGIMYVNTESVILGEDEWSNIARAFVRDIRISNLIL